MYRGRSTKLIRRPYKEKYSHSRGWQRVGFKTKVIFLRSNKKAISHVQGLVRFVHVTQWIPKGSFPVWRNFYVRTDVKFTFTNKIEAMHEWWLINIKVEPRLTSRLSSALFILPLFYLRELTCVPKNASVEINLK